MQTCHAHNTDRGLNLKHIRSFLDLKMSFTQFRVAIIGAGPAGLTLGALLHKKGVQFTIFEVREKPTQEELARPAGSLDLHEGTGLAALQEAELTDEFNTMIDDCSEAIKVSDKYGNILYAYDGNADAGQRRPEISRNKLTHLLLSHCPASAIRWKHKLIHIRRQARSQYTEIELDFAENGRQTFDFVVGADGAWSSIRALLNDIKPKYAGHQNITINIRNISTRYPQLAELVGSGTFMALGDRHGVISQRAVQDTARIYVFVATEDEDYSEKHFLRRKTATQIKKLLFDGDDAPLRCYGSMVKELVSVACDDETAAEPGVPVIIRPLYTIYETPDGYNWEHKSNVTLIGDAAHLMAPNGEGVNIAMKDALALSQAIIKARNSANSEEIPMQNALDSSVFEFEMDMLARAKEVAGETAELMEMMYGSIDGAKSMVDFFKSHRAPSE